MTTRTPVIPSIYDWMRENLPQDRPLILELGAHYGEDTAKFLSMFLRPDITVFEPDPRNITVLEREFAHHAVGFTLIPKAVGATDGHTIFWQSDGKQREWTHSGSIHKPKNHLTIHPSVIFRSTITVPLITLDTAINPSPDLIIDFIWCDIQGAEGDMIRGAPKTLARTHYIYTEFSDAEEYEGQIPLSILLARLPSWEPIGYHENNVLLHNTTL